MSDSVELKARVYLADGKVKVQMLTGERACLIVTGSGNHTYSVLFDNGWACSCPSRNLCAHIIAAKLITNLRPREHTRIGPEDTDITEFLNQFHIPDPDDSYWESTD